jgi:zinc transport system substrate-binding protein
MGIGSSAMRSRWEGFATLLSVWAIILLAGCGGPDPLPRQAAPRAKPLVYAASYPLAWIAERIGGADIEVVFPVPADVDPAFWRPDDAAIRAFQQADLILINGAGHARWIDGATLPESKLLDTSASFQDEWLPLTDTIAHKHGPRGKHAHTGADFNTWLDPKLAILQGRAVRDRLRRLLPARAEMLAAAWEKVEAELTALNGRWRALLPDGDPPPLLASHPVYNYLAKRHNWNLISLHWEPGETPDEAAWKDLQTRLTAHPARVMLWEDAPRADVAARLAKLGLRVAVVRPCGNRPPSGDYLREMNANIDRLGAIMTRP